MKRKGQRVDDFTVDSLEVGPMETEEYRPLVQAGADGLVVSQETYDRAGDADLPEPFHSYRRPG